jgi:hypothetical protein
MDNLLTPFIPQLLTDSQKLDKILLQQNIIYEVLNTIMTTALPQLDAAIATLNTNITSEDQNINAIATALGPVATGLTALTAQSTQLDTDVAALIAKLGAGQDYTNELNAVQSGSALVSQSTGTLATAASTLAAAATSLQTAATNVSTADAAAAGA